MNTSQKAYQAAREALMRGDNKQAAMLIFQADILEKEETVRQFAEELYGPDDA